MPFNYKSPGVYIEEVERGSRPIESAGTSVLAMIGMCRDEITVELPGTGKQKKATPGGPTLVTNWTEFTGLYGEIDQAVPGSYLHQSMRGFFDNGGTAAFVVGLPVKVEEKVEPPMLQLPPSEAYLLNAAGQRTIKIVSNTALKQGEEIAVEVQPVTGNGASEGTFNLMVQRSGAEPKLIQNLTLAKGRNVRNISDVLPKETDNLLRVEIIGEAENVNDLLPTAGSRTSLLPVAAPATPKVAVKPGLAVKEKLSPALFKGDVAQRTGIAGLEAVDEVTLVCCPDVMAAYENGVMGVEEVKAVQLAMIDHCEKMKDRFAILDCPRGLNAQEVLDWRKNKMNFDTKYAALYYPWIRVNGKFAPPSGYIAGVYSRVDTERGVHKAPANEQIRGALDLEIKITRNEQDLLNPVGINCIRSFPGQGIRIWGARTLASDARWRYINVRRLFSNVEKSILNGTTWIVFEPNDQKLWLSIRRDITAYLRTVWESGALFGATPDQAFYVKCDAETNPPNLRDLGYCVIEVGMAPVKPAEFVVFRISQSQEAGGASTE